MTTPNWGDLTLEDQDALTKADQQLKQMLDHGIRGENLAWPICRWKLKDGTESGIVNPMDGRPIGFLPLSAVNETDGSALTITGWKFNNKRPDGQMGITVSFSTAAATGYVMVLLVGG